MHCTPTASNSTLYLLTLSGTEHCITTLESPVNLYSQRRLYHSHHRHSIPSAKHVLNDESNFACAVDGLLLASVRNNRVDRRRDMSSSYLVSIYVISMHAISINSWRLLRHFQRVVLSRKYLRIKSSSLYSALLGLIAVNPPLDASRTTGSIGETGMIAQYGCTVQDAERLYCIGGSSVMRLWRQYPWIAVLRDTSNATCQNLHSYF